MIQPTLQVTLPAPNVPAGYRLVQASPRPWKAGEQFIGATGTPIYAVADAAPHQVAYIIEPIPAPAPEPVRKVNKTYPVCVDNCEDDPVYKYVPVTFVITGHGTEATVELAAAADARELREKLAAAEAMTEALRVDVATLKREREIAITQARFVSEQVERLTRELKGTKTIAATMTTERDDLYQQVEALTQQLATAEREREEARNKCEADALYIKEIKKLRDAEVGVLKSRLATLEGAVKWSVGVLEDLEDHMRERGHRPEAARIVSVTSRLTAAVEPVKDASNSPFSDPPEFHESVAGGAVQPPARLSPDEEESAYWEGRDAKADDAVRNRKLAMNIAELVYHRDTVEYAALLHEIETLMKHHFAAVDAMTAGEE